MKIEAAAFWNCWNDRQGWVFEFVRYPCHCLFINFWIFYIGIYFKGHEETH